MLKIEQNLNINTILAEHREVENSLQIGELFTMVYLSTDNTNNVQKG